MSRIVGSLRAAAMICDTRVITQIYRHTDRQLLTGYTISSASGTVSGDQDDDDTGDTPVRIVLAFSKCYFPLMLLLLLL